MHKSLVAVTLAGAALFAFPASASATELVSVSRSGGFFGESISITVDSSGTYEKDDNGVVCTGTLDAMQLQRARTMVVQTRNFTSHNVNFPSECCDFYGYSLSDRYGTTTFTPAGNPLPPSIESAAAWIDQLIGSTCSGSSS
jgi:hypothetical protein